MTTNNSKPCFSKMTLLSLACAASLGGAAQDAQAQNLGQCLKNTVNCGVNLAQTQIDLLSAATDVIAFTASSPHCIADIVAGNFVTMGISASMVSLAATGVIKQEGGSYTNYIYGQGGRPMVQAVSSIVPIPAISDLLKENDDALIGPAFRGITSLIPIPSAGAPTLERQLDCGNAIAVAGQGMIGKVKTFVGHAKGAVKSCSAAASCFAGVLLDIVKDPVGALGSAGEFLLDGADSVKDAIFGGCKNPETQAYFDTNFKPWVNPTAYNIIWAGVPNSFDTNSQILVKNCIKFFDSCNSDPGPAARQCLGMSTGEQLNGKGFEQLTRTRLLELRIPQLLATDMKWALAQASGSRDTAMINKQFERLPAQLQPLVKAKFSFSFKPAREAAVRKIMGFPPGYNGDGDFGGKDAKVVMADQSIGALMLAYVPTQGAEDKNLNTKVNALYKQYIPNGDAFLQQIDAAVAEQMGKAITEIVKQNGDAWNDAFTSTQLQKMVKRMDDCKNAHKDAQKVCKEKIATALEATFAIMPGMGKGKNFAGIGALGTQEPAYKNYVNFIQGADKTVSDAVVQSAMIKLSEVILGAGPIDNKGVAQGDKLTAFGAAAPPKTGPIGMPGAPTMGMIAVNREPRTPAASLLPFDVTAYSLQRDKEIKAEWFPQCKDAPPCIDTMLVLLGKRLSAEVAALKSGKPSHTDKTAVTAFQDSLDPTFDPQFKAAIPVSFSLSDPKTLNIQQTPLGSVASVLPYDSAAYRRVREKEIEAEWFPKCAGNVTCLRKMNELVDRLLDRETTALANGTPKHTDQAAVKAFQNSLDPIFDPLFKAEIPVIRVFATQLFDQAAYRRVREKEIKDEWMPKCGGASSCLKRMTDITENLLSREVTALTNGTPLHTDKAAVTAFQNSLDPTFDPQFKAAIPVATQSTTQIGAGSISNKKPIDLKPKF